MNILVTGGAGYLGSVCAEQLARQKHQVVAYDNLSAGHREAIVPGVIFVRGDVADSAKLRYICRRFKIEAVMHFAASALVSGSVRDPALFYRNNVSAGITLLEVVLENKIKKFIFSSSAAVYGEAHSVPITEEHPTAPINSYGETKLVFERALAWYHRAYGLSWAGLRYFNAAGATERLGEDHRPETHLLPRLLDAALDPATEFVLYGDDYPTPDHTCVRDFVHVLDIAQAHILALRRLPKIRFAIYNVGLGKGYSIRQVVRAVDQATGRRVRVKVGPRRIGDPATLVASQDKIRKELGWNARYSALANIVRSAWDWKRRHRNGYGREDDKAG